MMAGRYPAGFWWLCAGSFFFFGSFNMVIPELPAVLDRMGEGDHRGLIIALFTLTALVARPFSGRLADAVGRVPVMAFGAAVCVVCALIYPFISVFVWFVLLRLLHGFSTGFSPTGFSAYVADIVPENHRGEAIGLVTTFGSLGMAVSPSLGSWIAVNGSLDLMFAAAALSGLISTVLFFRLPETLKNPVYFRFQHLIIRRQDLFEPAVVAPCLVMILTAFSYGAMLTLVPDVSSGLGLMNKGVMFMVFALASVSVRIFAGRISDRYGRLPVLIGGVVFLIAAMVLNGAADSQTILVTGCIFYGFSNGVVSPTLFAWAADLCAPEHKARAFASLYMALELGIGLGALTTGYQMGGDISRAGLGFWSGAMLGMIALLFLLFMMRRRKSMVV